MDSNASANLLGAIVFSSVALKVIDSIPSSKKSNLKNSFRLDLPKGVFR